METIVIETQPTSEKNVATLKCILSNFDLMGPLRGPCLWVEQLNPNGLPFDGCYVKIDGDDWQNWPCDLTNEQDYEYLSSVILRKLGLDKRHKLLFTQYPQSQLYTGAADYNFTCETFSYPSGVSYQWRKDGAEIPGAVSNSYSISNAQMSDTGVYQIVATNSDFVITGQAYLATGYYMI